MELLTFIIKKLLRLGCYYVAFNLFFGYKLVSSILKVNLVCCFSWDLLVKNNIFELMND